MDSALKEVAKSYWDKGFNVVPIKISDGGNTKEPLNKYTIWKTQRQTEQDFNSLKWFGANAFAIVVEFPSEKHGYLGCLDFDTHSTSKVAQERGLKIIRSLHTLALHSKKEIRHVVMEDIFAFIVKRNL